MSIAISKISVYNYISICIYIYILWVVCRILMFLQPLEPLTGEPIQRLCSETAPEPRFMAPTRFPLKGSFKGDTGPHIRAILGPHIRAILRPHIRALLGPHILDCALYIYIYTYVCICLFIYSFICLLWVLYIYIYVHYILYCITPSFELKPD